MNTKNLISVYSNLRRKYIWAFSLIFLFTLIAQTYIQLFIKEQAKSSHVINLAGRQRMLSQRINKAALLLYFSSENSEKVKFSLRRDLSLLKESHADLKNGNATKDIEKPFSTEILQGYLELDPYVDIIEESAQCFLNNCKAQDENIKTLTKTSDEYLVKMNNLVFISDEFVEKEIRYLSLVEYIVFALITVIMLVEFFIILLPFQRKLLNHFKLQVHEENEKQRVYHMAEVGEISASVLHEINNFITIIKVSAEILKHRMKQEDAENETLNENIKFVNKIHDNVTRMISISRGMSKMTRKDEIVEFELKEVFDDIYDMIFEKLEKNKIEFEVMSNENVVLFTNKTQITQILFNLVKNAIHAQKGNVKSYIRISVKRTDEYTSIQISDNGNGVPKDLAAKIMEPFFTTKEVGVGSGLGLSLSRRLANSLGGDLILKSNQDPTIFQLKIKNKAV